MKKYNANFTKFVKILSDGAYHDGTTLGEQLSMTRSAIWKNVKKLHHYNIEIDSVKGKGYALLEPLILLEPAKIKKLLHDKKHVLTVVECLESTSDYIKSLPKKMANVVCIAEMQTQGRGRMNRVWHSPFAKNIYISLSHTFQKDVSELAGLSLVISLGILQALKSIGLDEKLVVKWPNDIFYNGKKLGGSLIEIDAESNNLSRAIIGIGINVNMLAGEGETITQPWISARQILNSYLDRNSLCANLLNILGDYLEKFAQQGFAPFIKEWEKNDCLTQQHISVQIYKDKIKGKVMGVNNLGQLIMKMPDGSMRTFSSGDTSILKA